MVDPLLDLVFFLGANKLAIVVNHAAKGVLLPDLLDLICQVLNLATSLIDTASKMLTAPILLLEEGPVLFHRLVLAITLSKHVECLRSVSQVLQAALDRPVYESLCISIGPIKATFHVIFLLLIGRCLLIQLKVYPLLLD